MEKYCIDCSRQAALLPVLLLCLLCLGCPKEVQINAVEVMPPNATETFLPAGFAQKVLSLSSTPAWVKGYQSEQDWNTITAYVGQVCTAKGYKQGEVVEIANLAQLGLSKDQVLRGWASPLRKYEVSVVNLRVLREKGARVEGSADYIIYSGGRSPAGGY